MTRPALPGLVRHEARALWLVWAGTAAACVIVAVTNQPLFMFPGRFAYFLGSVALAAMSVGHEYTHGTLPVLLTLPVERRRLITAKLLAVLPMLGMLALVTLTIGPGGPYFERGRLVGALSVVAAVSLAPWLTMLCHSPLAGGVFALGLSGMLQLASLGAVMAWARLGGSMAAGLETLHNRVLVASLIAISLLGAVAGWRAFMSLEAVDGRDAPLTWPRWLRSAMALDEEQTIAPPRRSHPYWLLVKKEARLQQMSLAVAAINVAFWTAAASIVDRDPAGVLAMVAVLYGGLVAVVIGALASAEERHLGTMEWQVLLPIAAWRQFAVKAAVALTLSLLLAFLLPLLLARGQLAVTPVHAGAVLLLTLASLVVSSRCQSGLQAVAVAAPTLLVVLVLLGWSLRFAWVGVNTALAIMAVLAVLALRSAFVNHRMARP